MIQERKSRKGAVAVLIFAAAVLLLVVLLENLSTFLGTGAVPSIFILLLVNPIQALIFCSLILIIQQFDGNFIGPKILGQSIGISALWVLFSIVVGGDLLGIPGMVIGVPVFATLYGLAQEFIHAMLDRRGIDAEGNAVAEEIPEEDNVFE